MTAGIRSPSPCATRTAADVREGSYGARTVR